MDVGDLETVVMNFNWLIGVELIFDDIILVLTGVDALDIFSNGDDNILFFNVNGPCIFLWIKIW